MSNMTEEFAQRILKAAIDSNQAAKLLHTLLHGGSCTITNSGQLIIIEPSIIDKMLEQME